MSTLDRPIWSRCSIALTCPARLHFQHTLSKERWCQGWDKRYCSSRKEKNDEKRTGKIRAGEERKKNRRPILRKLCATLLQSFREQHSKKINESAWGNWDRQEGQQPLRPNPNGNGDRTTTLRRLLIYAAAGDCWLWLLNLCVILSITFKIKDVGNLFLIF